MISLVCARCGGSIEVDDGFAGSTCRCAECGTIQTVPAAAADRPGGAGQPLFAPATAAAIASVVPPADAPIASEPPADLVDRALRASDAPATSVGDVPRSRRARTPGVPSTASSVDSARPAAARRVGVALAAIGAAAVVAIAALLSHRLRDALGGPAEPSVLPPASAPADRP